VSETFDDVANSKYILLTTFTKDGRPKPTPIWGVPEGRKLLISTDKGSWKTKRINNTPRVTIQKCGVLGKVKGEPVEAVAHEIGNDSVALAVDVSDAEQVQRMADDVLDKFGTLDVLVNNAGTVSIGNVVDQSVAAFDEIIAVNLRGVFLCSRVLVPSMLARGSGHIVNIASVAARIGFPGWAAYCASKAGVAGFSRALLEEVRASGVRVSVLYPGATDSPIWEKFDNDFNRQRMLKAGDVARAILWAVEQPDGVLVDEISLWYPLGNQ